MTTTGYPLPTNPEVREQLKAANFDPVILDPGLEQWFAGGYCFTLKDGQMPTISRLKYTDDDLPLDLALLFASILGIRSIPNGMRLIPEETIRGAIQVCRWHINATKAQSDLEPAPLVYDTKSALEVLLGAPSKGDGTP